MEALIRRATHWYVKQGKNGKEARALAERESLRRDWIIKEIEDVLERMIDDFKEARYQ
jgi:hypothetical protein